ncbi:MAG: putative metal-binding motif-containing protein, partial [Myxococcota bacterium]|nr:putative metal-binding motif-containing protein [Myxococcota bacterium]
PDGGTFDGGPPRDGGPRDGDVGDGGCTTDVACDDEIACTVDRCVDGVCERTPDDSVCVEGTTCDPVDGCPPRACSDDGECGDRRVCNGAETCVDMSCVPGMPVDCDDADACTVDVCDEAMRGECVHRTRDLDGDGFLDATCPPLDGEVADDCNDDNDEVFPGAPEICNGLDDDCESGCDEDFTCCRGEAGSCATTCGTTGTRVCTATCSWSICSPPAEECNAIDDDCNGAPDDVFACVRGATAACTTACGSSGTRTCGDACTWSDCIAPAETCNGRDDDCDAVSDEGFGCASGSSVSCTTSCGSTGSRACSASCALAATCAPPAEGCNGVDDDCDTRVDETVECSAGATGPCTTSCGSTGTRACSAGCTWNTCSAPAEVCNGSDDDCDGRVDETFACVPGSAGACSTSCGTTGARTCTSACAWGACTPPVEACNGADDNCDAACDETFACCAGRAGACTTSCGTTGMRTCGAACGWSACSPPAETCNGTDDDCNGSCDDGFTCCAGRTGSCTTACGSTGSRLCSASCGWGTCTVPAEACGGGDDDCDGTIDEGFACTPGVTGPCTTSCGTTGTRTCDPSCAWGTCAPPAEACNTIDDDCDAMIDEGCGSCVGCTGAIAVTGSGGRYTQNLTTTAQTGSCGGAGAEYTATFTLTAASDVFLTTHGASVDTVLYVRACGCTGTEVACSDNADGRTTSMLRLTNLAAGTYQVFVDSRTAAAGASVPLDIYITPPGAQSDRCGNPTAIAPAATSISGDTCTFTNDYDLVTVAGECPYTGAGDAAERVYYFYLPTSRTITVDGCTAGTAYDSAIFFRQVCNDGAGANQVACNDDGCSGGGAGCSDSLRSSRTVTLGPGLYYLFIDGYSTGTCACGGYQFTLSGF